MEIINLDDPSTLRRLIATATASSSTSSSTAPSPEPPFTSEFSTTSEDSDVENEEEEFVAVRSKHVMPVYRQPLHDDDIKQDDNHDEEEEAAVAWREGTTSSAVLDFTGRSGFQVQMEGETPLDYLRLMVNDEMVESLVAETNRYATQTLATRQLSPKSRFHQWVETSVNEMWAFFGLIVAMGLIVIENLDEYWSIDQVYK
ncbi:PiggyBac transposable element-derived protein 4 [Plakobranchus ocellatus]|uniref:PiggyBac transposable element-derived protein 4 n=1 Tax=Plakobranchus ocellatus TaxID=259542 RepID=A0AAV4CI86_9GAST|nr:PiggyBac transposable element-derived protein 4 [Plakobranchus ocellatus]